MSGTLYIQRLHDPEKDPYIYHDPEHGVFHCHYGHSALMYFGMGWIEFDHRYVPKRGKYKGKIPPKTVKWFYTYLRNRRPTRNQYSELSLEELHRWREELCQFLQLALEHDEPIIAHL
jgi:hypothetical protein